MSGSEVYRKKAFDVMRRSISVFLHQYLPGGPRWMGKTSMQWASDLFMYQEMMVNIKPTLLIETGTLGGGVPKYLNDIYYLMQRNKIVDRDHEFRIITIDIEKKKFIELPPNTTFIKGNSVSEDVVNKVSMMIKNDDIVMVFLDSNHSTSHVIEELKKYSKFVTVDSWIVVQDTSIDFRTNAPYDGPLNAVKKFLSTNKNFEIDHQYERWLCSQHPDGFLRRIK